MGVDNTETQVEQDRVQYVVNQIEKKEEKLSQKTMGLKADVIDIRKNFWENITVNLDEADDVIETQTSIKQQAELLSERERSHGQFYKKMKTYQKLKDSPYFGRIDFCEDGSNHVEKIYLGIASLMDEQDQNFLIYDWRSPISSLYYDYSPGMASYNTPDGSIQGNMELKRQYIIRNSVIKSMFDTGMTIGDELLQEVLGRQSDSQMKSIVATIQKEQNTIIRHQGHQSLVVQGVAGSGKTSAALQRVAYLLYRYRKTLKANNIILFSPNPLFNSYVSTVLPELGEENMEQTTFQDYLEMRLNKHFKLEDPFSQLEYTLSPDSHSNFSNRMAGIYFKATLDFKHIIDHYLNGLSQAGLQFRNIIFKRKVLISSGQIQSYFYKLDPSTSLSNRIEKVRDWLIKYLRQIEKEERTNEWVDEEISLLDKEDYVNVYHDIQKKQGYQEDSFDDLAREEKVLRKIVVNRHFKRLKKKIKRLEFINTQATYRRLFENNSQLKDTVQLPNNWYDICEDTMNALNKKVLYYEDMTPYLYFIDQLEGRRVNTLIRHVFIDEAQDYTPFQMAYIKSLFPKSKMTLLGDFNQAIYPHTLNMNTLFSEEQYGMKEARRIELTRSYRSTKEIVQFTRHLVENGERIDPFNRHGDMPTLTKTNDRKSHDQHVLTKVEDLRGEDYETIAIICKTAKECRDVYETFKDALPVQLMTKETGAFHKGILILPAYLAKGIEFDVVIIYDASKESYHQERERKLFYTACTRAMHECHLFSLGDWSPLMNNVPRTTYRLVN